MRGAFLIVGRCGLPRLADCLVFCHVRCTLDSCWMRFYIASIVLLVKLVEGRVWLYECLCMGPNIVTVMLIKNKQKISAAYDPNLQIETLWT